MKPDSVTEVSDSTASKQGVADTNGHDMEGGEAKEGEVSSSGCCSRNGGFCCLLHIFWGLGVSLWVLASAVHGLYPHALNAINYGMNWWQWSLFGLCVLIMAYCEGYKGFHRSFSPMLVVRSFHLALSPPPSPWLYAFLLLFYPFYVFGMLWAPWKRLAISWGITIGVFGLVLGIKHLESPYRGIVDAGVVVGLSMGTLSAVYWLAIASQAYCKHKDSVLSLECFKTMDRPLWEAKDGSDYNKLSEDEEK